MQPTGTITFLFTDIEGSTKLWERCPDAMRAALAIHDTLLRKAIESNNGYVFKTVGDAFCAAFPTAPDALAAALESHFALLKQEWGETGSIRVRMGLHTGDAEIRDNDYFGPTLNRTARLQSIAYGAQTLLSQTTYDLVRDRLPDKVTLSPLGSHRLKDLNRAEQVFQVLCPGLPADFPALKSLDSYPNNLPIQLTSFIGREQEMTEIKRQIAGHRVVTLLGPGGAGKSRLTLQVGADLLDQFADGVWFVELAPLADPSTVPQAIAAALGIKEETGRTLTQTLLDALKPRTALLILDNCEHLLDACARLAQALVQSCTHLTILASSREAFNIGGETIFRVPPLRQPDPHASHTAASLSDFEAVRLFIDRAVSVNAAFTVTNTNAPALAQLCARLDGIPLAIELAAARSRSLSVEELNGRLDHCFRILTGGSRTALPRQQTLRALIDWSYDLLSASEKALLQRVSVFTGGWTLEAAEQVCAGGDVEDWEMLDLLTNLSDKSLVVTEQQEGRTRYRLLETIRQYSRDRLLESGEADLFHERHLEFFMVFAETAEPELAGPEAALWLRRLESEHDNLRGGLAWGSSHRILEGNSREAGLRIAGALYRLWDMRGYYTEGLKWLIDLLAHGPPEPTSVRAKALATAGLLTERLGDYRAAQAFYKEGLTLSEQLGDKSSIAVALSNLGIVAFEQGDYDAARGLLERRLVLTQEAGNKQGMARTLNNLGTVAQKQGDYAAAQALYENSLAISRELGDKQGMAIGLNNLGDVAHERGDYAAARSQFEESLTIAQELGDKQGIACSLGGLAAAASGQKQEKRAAQLWGATDSLRKEIGSPLPPSERLRYDSLVAQTRSAIGEAAFAATWLEGCAMTIEQIIAFSKTQTP